MLVPLHVTCITCLICSSQRAPVISMIIYLILTVSVHDYMGIIDVDGTDALRIGEEPYLGMLTVQEGHMVEA